MKSLVIKEYGPEDREGCIALLEKTFPGRSDEATFAWRFETARRISPLLVCARDGETVVAFCSWLPWEFRYQDTALVGYQNGEAATEMSYRGRGLLGAILRKADEIAAQREIDFFFCFPNEKSYGPTVKAGYDDIGRHHFCLRPINPFLKRLSGNSTTYGDYPFDAAQRETDKLTPVIDPAYCTWRYIRNTKDCEIVAYEEGNRHALFFVRQKKWKGLNELILLDMQTTSYEESFIHNAMAYLDGMYSRRALFIRTFCNETSERGKALRRHFSVPAQSKFYTVCVKPMRNRVKTEVIVNLGMWDVMPHYVDEL